jgi:hypothetical protein
MQMRTTRYITRLLSISLLCLCGCAGGPTKDYYNPAVVGAKFKGPATMTLVEDVQMETERLVNEGYTVIGRSIYAGEYPEADELSAQAKRAGANHVVCSAKWIPAPPGSWNFRFGRGFGSGGTGGGHNDVHIVFLGR